jgi:hypothetical protein
MLMLSVATTVGKALTWHALGCYHLLLNRHDQAWRLFHKAAQQVVLLLQDTLLCTTTTVDITTTAVNTLDTSATTIAIRVHGQ